MERITFSSLNGEIQVPEQKSVDIAEVQFGYWRALFGPGARARNTPL
jgi:hypothetical protein